MKEFIKKLIERLEELKEIEKNRADSCDEDSCGDGEQIFDDGRSQGRFEQTHKIIKIINQLAEEYINTSTDTSSGWIACSERLPEYSDCYNVTVGVSNEMGYYECVKAFNYVKKQGEEGKWVVPKDLFSTYSVIAWQNTPAPYKEGE